MRLGLTGDRDYYKQLIHLAIPVALQNLTTFLVSFADNLMVNALGDVAVSGVYMGSQVQTLLQLLMLGVGNTLVIIGAQYWGKNDRESIHRLVAIAMRFALGLGLGMNLTCALLPEPILRLFTDDAAVIREGAAYLRIVSFSYLFFCLTQALIAALRCVEVTRAGMLVSLLSLVVNVTGNYALIFGKLGFPALGIRGAAIATLFSRMAEAAAIVAYIALRDRRLGFRWPMLGAKAPVLTRHFVRYGIPLVLGEVVWSVNTLAGNMILGRYGAGVITAVSVTNTMYTLLYVVIGGMASAVGIITGKTIGAGKLKLMREYAVTTELLFALMGLALGAVTLALNRSFVGLYTGVSPEARAQSVRLITVMAVSVVGTCYQMPCLFGLVKSGGDVSFVFRNDTLFVFGVVLPAALIAAGLGAPPWAVYACLKCDQILKCAVAFVKVNRFDWMKNLTLARQREAAKEAEAR